MDNLTFEFMERTKNIPLPPDTAQSLYRLKTLLVLVWVFTSAFYTSFIFMDRLLLFFSLGILLLLALCTPERPFFQRWEQLYTLAVIYCFLPFYTSIVVYVVCAVLAVLVIEFLFGSFNGYFLNPVVFILCFAMAVFPFAFGNPQLQPFFFSSKGSFFFLDSVFANTGHIPVYKEFLPFALGLFPSFPGAILGLLGMVVYILPFVPKLVYRTSFSYIVGVCVFGYVASLWMDHTGGRMLAYGIFLCGLFSKSGIVFTALFVIPETLGNPTRFRAPYFFVLSNAFFTVVCYILLPTVLLSSMIGFLVTFLFYYLMESFPWREKMRESLEL